MNRRIELNSKRLTVMLDMDDTVLDCNELALKMCNEEYGTTCTIEDISNWGLIGTDADKRLEFFNKEEFYEAQAPMQGARAFVKELSKMAEIFVATATPLKFMGVRAMQIAEFFPEIKQENIILCTRKDVISGIDILLDDGGHNILASNVKYPVLMRKPWNSHITGVLSVNNYDEFINLVKQIQTTGNVPEQCKIVNLVGPSGSEKTAIAEMLVAMFENFIKPVPCTTRKPRLGENQAAYNYISQEKFLEMKKNCEFVESTMYAGEGYGTTKKEIERIIKSGKIAVFPIDICGAMALKSYGAINIYIDRPKEQILKDIMYREVSIDEKVKRILSLENEERNASICDFIVKNNSSLENTILQILDIVLNEIDTPHA